MPDLSKLSTVELFAAMGGVLALDSDEMDTLIELARRQHFGCTLCYGGTADEYGKAEACEEVRRACEEATRRKRD